MGNVSSVIHSSIHTPWSILAMNATTEVLKGVVLFVEIQVSRTLITVENASSRKKIEMGVLRLSTWVLPKPICFTSGRNTDSKSGSSVSSAPYRRDRFPPFKLSRFLF